MNLALNKFDMGMIADDKIVVMIGKRGVGKSQLIKRLLLQHKSIPFGTVISPTEPANKFYSKLVPPQFIFDEYSPLITNKVVSRQEELVPEFNEIKERGGVPEFDPRAYFIMDDCLFDNTWQRDKRIREIFMNGRHWRILYVLAMQYAMGVPPILRTNIDFVFICNENNIENRKRLYMQYAGVFPSFEMFCQVMDQCTNDYECLVINNTDRSNDLRNKVFWYKVDQADFARPFRTCADCFWPTPTDGAAVALGDSHRTRGEFDPAKFRRPRGPVLNIRKEDNPQQQQQSHRSRMIGGAASAGPAATMSSFMRMGLDGGGGGPSGGGFIRR